MTSSAAMKAQRNAVARYPLTVIASAFATSPTTRQLAQVTRLAVDSQAKQLDTSTTALELTS